jgi:hypothetical protein
VAVCKELRPQLAPVVDFAVQQRLNRSILVRYRAVTEFAQIQDAQATMNQTYPAPDEQTFGIGATGRHALAHPPQSRRNDLTNLGNKDAADSAHQAIPRFLF